MKRRRFIEAVSGTPLLAAWSGCGKRGGPLEPPAPSAADGSVPPPRGGVWLDLARATPGDALSPTPRRGRWRTAPWKAHNGVAALEGTMLIAGQETRPPVLTFAPGLQGPHDLYIGLSRFMGPSHIRVKLDNDPSFVELENELTEKNTNEGHTRHVIEDCYFRTADMTGRTLQLAQYTWGDSPAEAMVGYVRAVPVPEARLRQPRRGPKRLVGMNDGHGIFYEGVRTEEDLWQVFLPYRDSAFSAMLFCITGADHCNYPTRVGTLVGSGLDDFPAPGYRRYVENVKAFLARGEDPLALTLKICRAVGLEAHVSIRVEAFAMEPPFDGVFMSRFYAAHPELRCVDRDGRRVARLSYAFPEVREHMFAIVDEIARYEPDGINLIFPRAQPYVLYEEPVLREFRARHGKDPRQLPDDHPEIAAVRAHFMSEFVGEVRRRTRRGSRRQPEVSAIVLSDEKGNSRYGLDLQRWIRERWVDEISPSVWDWRRWRTRPEAAYLAGPCKAAGCRLVVNLHPAELRYDQYRATALDYHRQGVDGFSIWDTPTARATQWALLQSLGGATERRGDSVPSEPSVLPLAELGDFVMDRYKSSWCF